MGRVDTNATQYHQGLEFEDQFHHEVLETIDDAPPHDEGQDLYEPVLPLNYNEKIGSQVPTDDKPRAFPPPQDATHHQEEHHHDMPQAFPPTPTHDQDEAYFPPQSSFPPQQDDNMQFSPQQIMPFPQGVQIGHPAPAVVMSSPFLQLPNQLIPTQPWKTNLFDCMRDPQNDLQIFSHTKCGFAYGRRHGADIMGLGGEFEAELDASSTRPGRRPDGSKTSNHHSLLPMRDIWADCRNSGLRQYILWDEWDGVRDDSVLHSDAMHNVMRVSQ
ncbi:hypothetical protein BUALT_Bualt02G0078800 [Buddleja alternifolia]|uniref:Uncharacterized protein n=1 Tax=Buddleja alternifolia TaxID=168488 RepID=A0AAV6XZZ5_9LAMI|nr:hypothetical protein BUALT_Bualt02G0078800 [Buddleja alternifolia]